ncbi:hypothetical protein [Umezawaea sp. Da 62-37]|uniref:hypothetical protein n=1 Tax=Umezawaea sp. Da 62-37 TaxID=3075927 RepID=UPI0028F72C41|nr:hypothetical protein [Umezawaea sp. Da 62-37]WNV87564.1 hypothetical protein RM788_04480 [Umezawaea sp. Da 62-37]
MRLKRPNALLLDAPTNTLVLVSTCRLEGALVVSHDGHLLRGIRIDHRLRLENDVLFETGAPDA